jgi:hypothetical protein
MKHRKNRRITLCLALLTAAFMLSGPASAGLPDSPDGTVKEVLQALADRHPEILWQALPLSYQQDITELTHAAAEKMDPEMWSSFFNTGRKVADVMRDKKEYFLSSSLMNAAGEEKARIEANWDTAVTALDSFFSSQFSDLNTFKTMDWERFLSTTGAELLEHIVQKAAEEGTGESPEDHLAKLRATTVETLSHDGDMATVRISAPGEDPEDVALTRVEGRWVPTDLATDWESDMNEAKLNIANVTEEQMAEANMQVAMIVGMVDGALDQLAATASQEEFDQAIQGLFGPFLGMAGAMEEESEEEEATVE